MDTLLRYKADPSLKLTHGLGSILCVAASFQAERRRTAQERMKLVSHSFLNIFFCSVGVCTKEYIYIYSEGHTMKMFGNVCCIRKVYFRPPYIK